jgi:hypothetical protein
LGALSSIIQGRFAFLVCPSCVVLRFSHGVRLQEGDRALDSFSATAVD